MSTGAGLFIQSRRGKRGRIGRPKSDAKKALNLAKKNRRQLNDYLEVTYTATLAANTGTLNATPAVLEVAGGGQEGNKIVIKSVRIQGWIRRNLASTTDDDYRVILLLDRNPRGALPTSTDVFGIAAPTINALKGSFDFKRFKILRSVRGILHGESNTMGSSALFDFYVKLNLIQNSQVAESFAVANLTKNALSVMLWTTATANQPTFSFKRAVTITDD